MNKVAALMLVTTLAGLGVKSEPAKTYTDEDLYVLSHIVSAEAGNCQEQMMLWVGSVVLNRVADDRFPNTIYEVVFQTDPTLQYGPTANGSYYKEPTEGAVEAAKKLLEEGSVLPPDVIYQSNERIGVYYDELDPPPGIGSTMYFGK